MTDARNALIDFAVDACVKLIDEIARYQTPPADAARSLSGVWNAAHVLAIRIDVIRHYDEIAGRQEMIR